MVWLGFGQSCCLHCEHHYFVQDGLGKATRCQKRVKVEFLNVFAYKGRCENKT